MCARASGRSYARTLHELVEMAAARGLAEGADEGAEGADSGGPPAGSLRVGCPMWVNRDWVGRQFPVDTPRGRELEAYARWCTAVEGNTTFYAVPSESAVARWAEQAPTDFRFALKLPKEVTHDRRLRDASASLSEFLRRVEPLRPVLGPFSVQLPESFGPDDLGVLSDFVSGLSLDFDWSVEVRHRAFDAGTDDEARLNDMLAASGVDRVLFYTDPLFASTPDSPEAHEAHSRKPRVRLRPVALAAHPVVRLIAPDDGSVDIGAVAEPWRKWWPHLARWIDSGRHVTVFAHTPDNLRSPDLARLVHEEVVALVPGLPALPDPTEIPGQTALF